MKVNLYATTYEQIYEDTLVWSGEMDCIPRVDDIVFFFDGWGGARVSRVYWELPDNVVELYIEDKDGEYSIHAKKIGVEEYKKV